MALVVCGVGGGCVMVDADDGGWCGGDGGLLFILLLGARNR